MAGLLDTIYRRSPTSLQHVWVSAYGWYWHRLRFSGSYPAMVRAFRERDRFDAGQLRRYQTEQLRRLLVHAYDHVPHYREAWRTVVERPQLERFQPEDLVYLPPLEKETVRSRPESLLVDGRRQKSQIVVHTSGSSGTPLRIHLLREEARTSLAVREVRSCGPAGVGFARPRATFSGRVVVPDPQSPGPFHRYNAVERQVYFSAFHLSRRTAPTYVAALRRHRTVWMTGYASSIHELARLALEAGLEPGRELPTLEAVITTSEALTRPMRSVIAEAFGARVFEEYSSVENAFFASENEHGQLLSSSDFGILESVDHRLRPQAAGVPGEALATGLTRFGQPLIRFRVGDLVTLSDRPALCGRPLPVLESVVGRLDDTVYAPDGRRLVRFNRIFLDLPGVREAQVVQEALDRIRVRVVGTEAFGEPCGREIQRRVARALGPSVRIEIEPVPSIERTAAGKMRAVVSRLTPEEIQRVVDTGTAHRDVDAALADE
ncbi:MAG: phenylacetate--CoA ligase family protein [Acidobacteria bacterium]|nr:MAG: phenylacetate--CoA ligase family protein [Acidobacteriota bacterium]REK07327.1 MAG: phenylacetate--CoA ligase family protein [Acidobacteriota bacterium]